MLEQHIADAFLTLQNLLEQYEVLVLHRIDVAWQILSYLLHGEMLRVLVIFVQLLPQLLVDALLADLLTEHVTVIHVVADTLK